MQINNNTFQRNSNISMVVQLLWNHPGISRVEIARRLDLYRSTVSNIINTLLDHEFIIEEKNDVALPQGGRKPICLKLNGNFGCVLGIELHPSQYRLVIINTIGETICFKEASFSFLDIETECMHIIDDAKKSILQNGPPLLGICISVPGIVNSATGTIVRSEVLGVKDIKLSRVLGAKYKIPVLVENDANCIAWREVSKKTDLQIQNILCISSEYYPENIRFSEAAGMSVGIGCVFNGEVYSGSHCAAGEYRSSTWRTGLQVQTGLDPKDLENFNTEKKAFSIWFMDFLASLTPIITLLDPEKILFYGELESRKEEIQAIFETDGLYFKELLKVQKCDLQYSEKEPFAVAKGAAAMYFMSLLKSPLHGVLDWDIVFALSKKGS